MQNVVYFGKRWSGEMENVSVRRVCAQAKSDVLIIKRVGFVTEPYAGGQSNRSYDGVNAAR